MSAQFKVDSNSVGSIEQPQKPLPQQSKAPITPQYQATKPVQNLNDNSIPKGEDQIESDVSTSHQTVRDKARQAMKNTEDSLAQLREKRNELEILENERGRRFQQQQEDDDDNLSYIETPRGRIKLDELSEAQRIVLTSCLFPESQERNKKALSSAQLEKLGELFLDSSGSLTEKVPSVEQMLEVQKAQKARGGCSIM